MSDAPALVALACLVCHSYLAPFDAGAVPHPSAQVVEYDSSSSLYEQLLQMRDTGVYISVHTSNLANAPLLQPGSAVFEIIQRNWHWNGLDTSFRDQTWVWHVGGQGVREPGCRVLGVESRAQRWVLCSV